MNETNPDPVGPDTELPPIAPDIDPGSDQPGKPLGEDPDKVGVPVKDPQYEEGGDEEINVGRNDGGP